jgi:CubicO group peptidase (beta-lactamase class C family)
MMTASQAIELNDGYQAAKRGDPADEYASEHWRAGYAQFIDEAIERLLAMRSGLPKFYDADEIEIIPPTRSTFAEAAA